jgi:mono/diheme cytochrome c family protein
VRGKGLAFLLLLPVLGGCEWFTDFKRQPSLATWQVVIDSTHPSRTNPPHSVPTTGMRVTGYQVSYNPMPATVDSMSPLANPVAADARSLASGHRYYQINCAVCHGDRGMGDGPATQFGMVGINIVGDMTRARTDGYIWGIIRNGRGLMPGYARIEEERRWDVVNYIRGLQNGTPGLAAGPVALPGVTGDAVPGVTRIAPTVPAHTRVAPRTSPPAAADADTVPAAGFPGAAPPATPPAATPPAATPPAATPPAATPPAATPPAATPPAATPPAATPGPDAGAAQ